MSARSVSATTRPVPEKAWFGGQLTAKLKEIEYPWAKSTGGQRNDVCNYVRRFCPDWCFLQFCPVRQHTPIYDWRSPDRTGQRRIPQRHHLDPQTFGLASLGSHPAPRPQLSQGTQLDDRRFSLDTTLLPPQTRVIQDGAVSHARVRLGVGVFRSLFYKLTASLWPIEPDFHGYVSAAFDGSTGTMPDTECNVNEFHKPRSRSGNAAFPQMRMMTLMALPVRLMLDVAYAPYTGKGTGERSLVREILSRLVCKGLLFLLDQLSRCLTAHHRRCPAYDGG